MTGVTITVPTYEEVEGPLGGTSVEYVINISIPRRALNSQWDDDEVLVYKAAKSYRECEGFYSKMTKKYPALEFPRFPPSANISTGRLEDRRKTVDEVMKFVGNSPDVCTCQLLLNFLGIDPSKEPTVETSAAASESSDEPEMEVSLFEKVKLKQDTIDNSPRKQVQPENLFPEPENEDDNDIFRESKGRKRNGTGSKPLFDELSLTTRNEKLVAREPLLFDPQDYGGPISPDEEHLFLVPGARSDVVSSQDTADSLEDAAELLSLDDDLSHLLDQVKPKKKPPPPVKPPLAAKPSLPPKPTPAARKPKPVPPPRNQPVPPPKPVVAAGGDSDEVDILKYIEDEEKSGHSELSLFS